MEGKLSLEIELKKKKKVNIIGWDEANAVCLSFPIFRDTLSSPQLTKRKSERERRVQLAFLFASSFFFSLDFLIIKFNYKLIHTTFQVW